MSKFMAADLDGTFEHTRDAEIAQLHNLRRMPKSPSTVFAHRKSERNPNTVYAILVLVYIYIYLYIYIYRDSIDKI